MLPDSKQTRASNPVSPQRARVMLVGTPKVGKTTLVAKWNPDHTLIIDTQGGTHLLDGEHYVAHVNTWLEFEKLVTELTGAEHRYTTVAIDLVDDLWNFCDKHHAGQGAVLASATDDWQRSIKTAEGMFRDVVGRLLASSMGVWFVSHAKEKQDGKLTRYAAKLDGRILSYVQGAVDFVLLAEKLETQRLIHTQPSEKFEAGSRVPMPEPLPLDARKLWAAIEAGLNPKPAKRNTKPAQTEAPQEVAA